MAYTIKPSIGMLPIEDIDKAMKEKGFIKDLTNEHIKNITKKIDSTTKETILDGIDDPSRIAICAIQSNEIIDRETIKNSLYLGGKKATDYLTKTDKSLLENVMSKISEQYSKEVQLLRDELYNLKAELVKTGNINDTLVADGFIDGFKNSNKKYSTEQTEIYLLDNAIINQKTNILNNNDWVVVEKNKLTRDSNIISKVIQKSGNKIKIESGVTELSEENTLLHKSLGEYNKGTFSFSKITYNSPDTKERYTMLNDDSNLSKCIINKNNTGFATIIKIPSKCAGFLTKFTVSGKAYGNPGTLKCYVVDGDVNYIKSIAKTNGLSRIEDDNSLVAISGSMTTIKSENEIIFDFTKTEYDNNGMYPIINDKEYCFIIEADNVDTNDYWEIDFGKKKNLNEDLQTNNYSFDFYNKDLAYFTNCFVEKQNIDMLYCITTKSIKEEDEIPYSVGLYSTSTPIKLSNPITATRARLTLEVNKEGIFITKNTGLIKKDINSIEFSNIDGTYPTQTLFNGGDKVIIGDTIANVKTSTSNSIAIDKNIYISEATQIYRCGYKAQLRLRKIIKDSNDNSIINSEIIYPLELVSIISSGRKKSSPITDRLIFETTEDINIEFNEADLQIKWNSALPSETLSEQLSKGNDYIGRIYNMNVTFDNKINI